MMKSKNLIFLTVSVLSFLFVANVALAATTGIVPCGGSTGKECNSCFILKTITNIYDFITLTLFPPVAVLMFVIVGIMFFTSGGSEDRLTKAKGVLWATVIGVIIILASYFIVHEVINVIGTKTTGFDPINWSTYECKPSASL